MPNTVVAILPNENVAEPLYLQAVIKASDNLDGDDGMANSKPKLIGLNHIALVVGDVDEALRFYGAVFSFELRGCHKDDDGRVQMAFLDMGDQFLALARGRKQSPDKGRHFGLVVDDRSDVMTLAAEAGATVPEGRPFNFLDPWGNHIEVVDYRDVQFTKTDAVLKSMGLKLDKGPEALEELRKKGITPSKVEGAAREVEEPSNDWPGAERE
ncbi:lactoylglutathione lyase family protein [Rhizobium leguminosarum bv. trifolii WSM2297]|uniref:Lactoylglutathione lyase family protein n=1 Tax=Rhizobium leguminosarum bv. trifolii WSM2297 TaxID=754762 RepID=J0KRU5_RHILT|nr:VOC family protein [Rhizobium leguminosarum]EJC80219.1 lactoylglutathione lyase family protein [Rhizobium leguminosarum bv. trifolii WSM2297]